MDAAASVVFIQSHKDVIKLLCRVCGERLEDRKPSYEIKSRITDLNKAFLLGITEVDSVDLYPTKFCEGCRLKLRNVLKRGVTTTYKPRSYWSVNCSSGNCEICNLYNSRSRGRKRKKKNSGVGRPSFNTDVWTRKLTETLLTTTESFGNYEFEPKKDCTICFCPLCNKV